MTRDTIRSVLLLLCGATAVVVGVQLLWGLGAALVVTGLLLFAGEYLS